MIIFHQDNVAAFAGNHTRYGVGQALQQQRISISLVGKALGNYSVLGPGAYPRPPYASFAGKAAAGVQGRLLLINPPGLDGGFGTGLSL